MLNKQMISKFLTSTIVLALSSGTLVLALNPAVRPALAVAQAAESFDVEPGSTAPVAEAKIVPQPPADAAISVPDVGFPQSDDSSATAPLSVTSEVIEQQDLQSRQLQSDDYQNDWIQAGEGSVTPRRHAIRLGEDGSLRGRLSKIGSSGTRTPVSNLAVSVVDPRGSILGTAVTNQSGEFVFVHMHPGVTGLVANGVNGLVAVAFDALPAIPGMPQEIASLQIDSAAISSQDITLALQIIHTNVPHGIRDLHWSAAGNDQIPAGVAEGGNAGDSNAVPGTGLKSHPIHLQPDGSLIGRIRSLHPVTGHPIRPRGMSAFLLQGGTQVGTVALQPDGTFSFAAVQAGVYSFVTAGLDGFSVFSIEVLPPVQPTPEPVADTGSDAQYVPVNLIMAETPEVDAALCFPTALNALFSDESPGD